MQQNITLVFAQIMYISGYVILCNAIIVLLEVGSTGQSMCLVMYIENT